MTTKTTSPLSEQEYTLTPELQSLRTKLNDLKAKVAANSISPQYLGSILDEILTFILNADRDTADSASASHSHSLTGIWVEYPTGADGQQDTSRQPRLVTLKASGQQESAGLVTASLTTSGILMAEDYAKFATAYALSMRHDTDISQLRLSEKSAVYSVVFDWPENADGDFDFAQVPMMLVSHGNGIADSRIEIPIADDETAGWLSAADFARFDQAATTDFAKAAFIPLWSSIPGLDFDRKTAMFTSTIKLDGTDVGIKDIAMEEAMNMYNRRIRGGDWSGACFGISRINIFPHNYPNPHVQVAGLFCTYNHDIEICWCGQTADNYLPAMVLRNIYSCRKLRIIAGRFNLSGGATVCKELPALEELRVAFASGANNSLSLPDSPLLSLATGRYLVTMSNVGGTVTVHPDVYARLTGYTYNPSCGAMPESLRASWGKVLTDGKEHDITFIPVHKVARFKEAKNLPENQWTSIGISGHVESWYHWSTDEDIQAGDIVLISGTVSDTGGTYHIYAEVLSFAADNYIRTRSYYGAPGNV